MTIAITKFDGEYEAVGAWTGLTVAEQRQLEERHDGPRLQWLAWDGDRVAGVLHPWVMPDGRHRLFFGKCSPEAYVALAGHVPGEVYATFDDPATVGLFRGIGFEVNRQENQYKIGVSVFEAPVPEGLTVISAADTELEKLMMLDCALREDVPGSEGWQPDAQWFREETYDSPYFDPEAYLVALDGEDYVGLVRIWKGPRPVPRLGLIGLLPDYRRRGLARALVSQAFRALHARGVPEVVAEADVTNVASNALLTGLGGVVTGQETELRRPA
ncbi:GNAT family N-acetyltransferase [Longispora albida]|uniref:GNAT family N-acetyltransferase n=1 Tax=Longispora albida TaxID=203523 RepID=UPI00035CB9FF|nr:GNAT family N-acetyltransferase [Longispora albida]